MAASRVSPQDVPATQALEEQLLGPTQHSSPSNCLGTPGAGDHPLAWLQVLKSVPRTCLPTQALEEQLLGPHDTVDGLVGGAPDGTGWVGLGPGLGVALEAAAGKRWLLVARACRDPGMHRHLHHSIRL